MTRASLLRILDHVNGISDEEVRELEQLAAAFPYCQTAHVLLAKTAHDRGSMLAGQRLRRAATYAADRELLRQLLERPAAPLTEAAAAVPTAAIASVDAPQTYPIAAETPPPAPLVSTGERLSKLPAALEVDLFAVEVVAAPSLADETALVAHDSTAAKSASHQAPDLPTAADETTPAAAEAATLPEVPVNAPQAGAPEPVAAEEELPKLPEPAAEPTEIAEPAPIGLPETEAAAAEEPASTEAVAEPEVTLATVPTIAEEEALEDSGEAEPAATIIEENPLPTTTAAPEASGELLPAVAPPIRPPSNAGISRFEFGLSESRLPEPTGYQLPGMEDEEEEPDPEEPALPTAHPKGPARITAPFRADAELGYALGGGSRLGYDLRTRSLDGFALDLPLESFFEPDALLLAHARAHQPAPKASSLDLINRFLKAQPRIKAGTAGVPLPTDEQADLSVRNSTAAPVLASESLAKIMVRQGKTAKAIEIYERLMAKQPEKMAYFAEQIQQLQQPPE